MLKNGKGLRQAVESYRWGFVLRGFDNIGRHARPCAGHSSLAKDEERRGGRDIREAALRALPGHDGA
jgi:hypothetical protein